MCYLAGSYICARCFTLNADIDDYQAPNFLHLTI